MQDHLIQNYSAKGTARAARAGNNRKALCIGIDSYPTSPLSACVADARAWSNCFQGLGFDVQTLLDRDATRNRILNATGQLIRTSTQGDVLAIQYSGHGTQLPGGSGDERSDEALVPIDHRQNGYVIDDDLAALCDRIPSGVSVTFFMDCCHSGTNTRLLRLPGELPHGDEKVRFLAPDAEMIETHFRTRRNVGMRSARSPYTNRLEILMAACKDKELSYESGGQGHFTRESLQVLRGGTGRMTNGEFIDRVRAAFGPNPRQTPELWSDPKFWDQPLLAPRAADTTSSGGGAPTQPTTGQPSSGSTLDRLEHLIDRLEEWLRRQSSS